MPTQAEDWHAKKEKQDAIVQNFLEAKPGSIDASESVLMARLSGLGLRGDYLSSEVRQAMGRRAAFHPKYEIKTGLDGKQYAVFAHAWDAEQAASQFKGCVRACFGQYDNAYELTSDYWHSTGRTKAGNNIG